MLAWIQLILNLPAVINSLWAKIQALEDAWAAAQKEKEKVAIDQTVKDSENAQTSEDVAKAAHEAADVLQHL